MEFKVTTSDEMTNYYRGDSRYKIEDNGSLTIRDDGGQEIHHSPTFWRTVEHARRRSSGDGRVTML